MYRGFPKNKRVAFKPGDRKWSGVYIRTNSAGTDQMISITYFNGNGKEVRENVGLTSEGVRAEDALDMKNKVEAQKRESKSTPIVARRRAESGKISEVWDRFVEQKNTKAVNYCKKFYESHIYPRFKDMRLSDIGGSEVAKFRKYLWEETILSWSTVTQILGILKRLLTFASQRGMIYWDHDGPVDDDYVVEKIDNKRQFVFNVKQAKVLFMRIKKHAKDDAPFLVFRTMLTTGLRTSETANLRKEWIDLERMRINFPGRYKGKDTTKSRADKVVFFDEFLRDVFADMMSESKEGYLFTTSDGVPYNKQNLDYIFRCAALPFNRKIIKFEKEIIRRFKAGQISCVEYRKEMAYVTKWKAVPYSLRHSYATWLSSDNVTENIIANRLGHSSTRHTRRYAKSLADVEQQYQQGINEKLAGIGF